MKRTLRRFSPSLALVLLLGRAEAGTPELRPGQPGVVRTVLEGSAVVEIPLRFVGTLEDFVGPGHDLHLVRLEGEAAEHIGVAGGMSGSPVYIDGQLIGALSYRMGTLPKDPLAGVTPIDEVLDARRAAGPTSAPAGAQPIALPLQVRGLAAEVGRWLEPQLVGSGLVLGASPSGGVNDEPRDAAPLAPGSPVAVVLVRGDVTLAATGTVTWVDGETVWAFGHPFFGDGRTEMPMHRAEVVVTAADLLNPGKLSRLGPEIGAILDDRLTAIVGRIGARADMIPLEVRVHGGDYGTERFEFEIVRHAALTPLLAGVSVANSVVGNAGFNRHATLHAQGKIAVAGAPELRFAASVSGTGPEAHALAVASRLVQLLTALRDNPFAEAAVERIEIDVEARREVRRYAIEALMRDRGAVEEGAPLGVDCVLREFRGVAQTRRFELALPSRLAEGTRLVLVAGSPEALEATLGRTNQRRLQTATDLPTYVRALGARAQERRLAVALYRVSSGVVARGESYPDLPPTAERLLLSERTTPAVSRTTLAPLASAEAELDGPVTGTLVFRLRVQNGRLVEDSAG